MPQSSDAPTEPYVVSLYCYQGSSDHQVTFADGIMGPRTGAVTHRWKDQYAITPFTVARPLRGAGRLTVSCPTCRESLQLRVRSRRRVRLKHALLGAACALGFGLLFGWNLWNTLQGGRWLHALFFAVSLLLPAAAAGVVVYALRGRTDSTSDAVRLVAKGTTNNGTPQERHQIHPA